MFFEKDRSQTYNPENPGPVDKHLETRTLFSSSKYNRLETPREARTLLEIRTTYSNSEAKQVSKCLAADVMQPEKVTYES